jgi:hypothetical protein
LDTAHYFILDSSADMVTEGLVTPLAERMNGEVASTTKTPQDADTDDGPAH